MSDRPMRLKYLTKMKIILCIFLLYITVSVFGEPQELNGILGQSVKFPAAVKKEGNLMHKGVTIGKVKSGSFTSATKKVGLQWDNSTGLFFISELEMDDSGEYEVQNTDQNINTVFHLNVYITVSKPHVSVTRDEYPCSILCTVERGTEVTLSWHREGEKKPYGSYPPRSAPYLDLPVPVEGSGTYTCEAKNSVSSKTSDPLTVGPLCTVEPITALAGLSAGTIVAISVIAAVAITIVVLIAVFAVLYCCIRRKHPAFRRIIQELRPLSERNDELETEKGDPPPN